MRDGAAHGGGIVHRRHLDAALIEGGKIHDRGIRLDDVSGVGDLVDRAERHFGHPLGILRQEADVPDAFCRGVGDLSGVLVDDEFHRQRKPKSHLLAEIDRHAGIIAVLCPGAPERAARRADRDRHPQLAGWCDFVFQGIGIG